MKHKISKLFSILLALVMMAGLLPGQVAYAYSEGDIPGTTGTGTVSDPILVDTFQELKAALQSDEELYITVNNFEKTTGLQYYALEPNVDYDNGGSAIIQKGTKHLTINTKIDIRTSSAEVLMYSGIRVGGNLIVDGSGEICFGFNATAYPNAVFFVVSPGKLTCNGISVSVNNQIKTYGYAIQNYSGILEINSGRYSGQGTDLSSYTGGCDAIFIDSTFGTKINGGTFYMSNKMSADHSITTTTIENVEITAGTFSDGIYVKKDGAKISSILGEGCYLADSSDNEIQSEQNNITEHVTVKNRYRIDAADVTVTAPVAGQTPKDAVSATEHVAADTTEWTCEGVKLSAADKFEAGKTYRLYVRVNTDSGYSFSDSPTVTFNNDTAGTISYNSSTNLVYYADFEAIVPPINTVDVTVAAPMAGQMPKDAVSATEHVAADTTEWTCEGVKLSATDKFEAGKTYRLYVRVNTDSGYSFADSPTVTFNNATAGTISYKSSTNLVYYADFEVSSSPATAPTITTSTLPSGKVGTAYNQTLAATGDATITWAIESGNLPAELTLATDGKISGMPSAAGTYTFTVKASNEAGSDTKSFTVTIAPADATTYTVTFNANGGGGTMADVTVNVGEKLTLPECTFTPPSADKEFDQWDAGKPGEKVDITSDCTIMAIWKDKTVIPTIYTVTFKDGESTLSTATVNSGEKVAKPTNPTKTGYTFNGWYADATFAAAFDFDQAITANTTVYAKFTENSVTPPGPTTYTVSFKDGESTLSTATVNSGDKVAKPADPTKTEYTFNGWYADATFTAAFDFDQAITANTTVYAKFTQNSVTPPVTITYTVTGGADSTWTKGSSAALTVTVKRSEADDTCFSHFTGVEIDGTALAASDYEAVSGSTVVTIKAAALQKLSTGKHTVTVKFDDGETSTSLTVKAASGGMQDQSPQTGDESNIGLWIALMALSMVGLLGVAGFGSKRRTHGRHSR